MGDTANGTWGSKQLGEHIAKSSGVTLRQFHADKLARFKELKALERKTKKDLEELLESWPELDARELRGQEDAGEAGQ